jgi:ABC-type multidrug transport system permease subunit
VVEVPLVILRSLLIFLVCYWTMGLQGNFFYLSVEIFALQMVANSTALLIGSMLSSVEAVSQAAPLLFVPQVLLIDSPVHAVGAALFLSILAALSL